MKEKNMIMRPAISPLIVSSFEVNNTLYNDTVKPLMKDTLHLALLFKRHPDPLFKLGIQCALIGRIY